MTLEFFFSPLEPKDCYSTTNNSVFRRKFQLTLKHFKYLSHKGMILEDESYKSIYLSSVASSYKTTTSATFYRSKRYRWHPPSCSLLSKKKKIWSKNVKRKVQKVCKEHQHIAVTQTKDIPRNHIWISFVLICHYYKTWASWGWKGP